MPDSPNSNRYSFYFAAFLAIATAMFTWIVTKTANDVKQDEAIEDLENLTDSLTDKVANRFTRDDGDTLRERLIQMNDRLIRVEVEMEVKE